MKENNSKTFLMSSSYLIAMGVFLGLLLCASFTAGYFLGKKKAIEEFCYTINQESFADHIYSSMCGLYEEKDDSDTSAENSDETISDTSEEKEAKTN